MATLPLPEQPRLEWLYDALRRIAGDPPHANIPESLRSKGVLYEMKESQEKFFAERRERDSATDARMDLFEAKLTALEKGTSRTRRTMLRLWRWASKKDDGVSIAFGKMTAIAGGLIVFGSFVKNAMPVAVQYFFALLHAKR